MNILFVTRKFPPSVGGLETSAYELSRALAAIENVTLVKWGGLNKYLPAVYPWLALRALWICWTSKIDVIYLQDGVLAPMGVVLQTLAHKPCVITVNGLEVTYKNPLYQFIIKRTLPRIGTITAISSGTQQEILRMMPFVSVPIITLGVNDELYMDAPWQELFQKLASEELINAIQGERPAVLLTAGRLVPRKGVLWFVENVVLELAKRTNRPFQYLIAGNGPDKKVIEQAIARHRLDKYVKLLGKVNDEQLQLLYNAADIFVMPNIPVPGDVEGFGLVAIEASSCGTPVVATGIEGIRDAVQDGQNGYLLPANDAEAFVRKLTDELAHPTLKRSEVRRYTLANFSWTVTARRYADLMAVVCGRRRG